MKHYEAKYGADKQAFIQQYNETYQYLKDNLDMNDLDLGPARGPVGLASLPLWFLRDSPTFPSLSSKTM